MPVSGPLAGLGLTENYASFSHTVAESALVGSVIFGASVGGSSVFQSGARTTAPMRR